MENNGEKTYIHYHCRHLIGIDFDNLTETVHRNGAAVAPLPTITAPITPNGTHFLYEDYAMAQSVTDKPVKITVPGPLTIMDTTANKHYKEDKRLAIDLADALNFEIRHLAESVVSIFRSTNLCSPGKFIKPLIMESSVWIAVLMACRTV